jgi:hypothetical protein
MRIKKSDFPEKTYAEKVKKIIMKELADIRNIEQYMNSINSGYIINKTIAIEDYIYDSYDFKTEGVWIFLIRKNANKYGITYKLNRKAEYFMPLDDFNIITHNMFKRTDSGKLSYKGKMD